MKPSEGSITLDDKKIMKPGKDRGMVFQQAALFPWLSVEENVMFPLRKEMKKNEAREVAHKYLNLVQFRPIRNILHMNYQEGCSKEWRSQEHWR